VAGQKFGFNKKSTTDNFFSKDFPRGQVRDPQDGLTTIDSNLGLIKKKQPTLRIFKKSCH